MSKTLSVIVAALTLAAAPGHAGSYSNGSYSNGSYSNGGSVTAEAVVGSANLVRIDLPR